MKNNHFNLRESLNWDKIYKIVISENSGKWCVFQVECVKNVGVAWVLKTDEKLSKKYDRLFEKKIDLQTLWGAWQDVSSLNWHVTGVDPAKCPNIFVGQYFYSCLLSTNRLSYFFALFSRIIEDIRFLCLVILKSLFVMSPQRKYSTKNSAYQKITPVFLLNLNSTHL